MTQIAMAGAEGLQEILRIIAEWMGEDVKKVSVTPNLDFADSNLSSQSMVEQQTSRNLGFPISARSLHQLAFDNGVTKLTFEEEMAQAEKEKDTIFGKVELGGGGGDQNPNNDPEANKSQKDKQKEQTKGATK